MIDHGVSQTIYYLCYGDARSQHFHTLNRLENRFEVILDRQRTEMACDWFYYLQGLGTHDLEFSHHLDKT